MKKIKKILALALTTIMLTSCNKKVFDFNYEYSKVHLYETGCCYEINNWRDYQDGEQIQVDIKGYGIVLTSSISCFLVKDKCPICDYE